MQTPSTAILLLLTTKLFDVCCMQLGLAANVPLLCVKTKTKYAASNVAACRAEVSLSRTQISLHGLMALPMFSIRTYLIVKLTLVLIH